MKIAVIGCGSIGARHYRNLKRLGYPQVRGWDIDPTRGESIDWSWRPGVVLICTPPETHMPLAIAALQRDIKGLFIEKPVAVELDDNLRVAIDLARVLHVNTMIAANWRFRRGVRELLFRPGPLRFEACIPIPPERRAGEMWDIGSHFVDLARWSEHGEYGLAMSYEAPYLVRIECGGVRRTWRVPGRNNQMFMDEMRHFLRCVRTGEPTGNDLAYAAETLKLALEAKHGL